MGRNGVCALDGTRIWRSGPTQLGHVEVVSAAIGTPGCELETRSRRPRRRCWLGGGSRAVGADVGDRRVGEGVVEQTDDLLVERLIFGGILWQTTEKRQDLAELRKKHQREL